MGFFMDGLDAEAYDRSYADRDLVARILGYFHPARAVMAFVAAMIMLNALMDTVLPVTISKGIDLLTTTKGATTGAVTLLITHRLSQIRQADLVLVLDRGAIVDQGAHDELLARCALYRRIFHERSAVSDQPSALAGTRVDG